MVKSSLTPTMSFELGYKSHFFVSVRFRNSFLGRVENDAYDDCMTCLTKICHSRGLSLFPLAMSAVSQLGRSYSSYWRTFYVVAVDYCSQIQHLVHSLIFLKWFLHFEVLSGLVLSILRDWRNMKDESVKSMVAGRVKENLYKGKDQIA